MKRIFTKKRIIGLILSISLLYVIAMAFLYFNQEKFFFHPKTLATNYQYHFDAEFEEINIPVDKNNTINSLLFKSKNSKGVIKIHGFTILEHYNITCY